MIQLKSNILPPGIYKISDVLAEYTTARLQELAAHGRKGIGGKYERRTT